MKTLVFFSISIISMMIVKGQVNKVQKNFNTTGVNTIETTHVPNGGVLVSTGRIENVNGTYKYSTDIIYYDLNLQEKWNREEVLSGTISKEEIMKKFELKPKYNESSQGRIVTSVEESYQVTKDGKHYFSIDQMNDGNVYYISLEDGSSQLIELNLTENEKLIQIKCGIDDKNFYVVRTFMFEGDTDKMKFDIFQININTLEVKKSHGVTLSNQGTKYGLSTTIRYWDVIGVGKDGLFLADNYGLKDKATKEVYRRVLKVSLDGKILKDEYLYSGNEILYKDYLGKLYYNRFGNGRFYSFSLLKKNKTISLLSREYNSDLEEIWSEEVVTDMVPAKGDFSHNIYQKYTHGAVLSIYQADTRIYQSIEIGEPEDPRKVKLLEKDFQKQFYKKYSFDSGISFNEYILISEYPEVVEYVDNIISKNKKVDLEFEFKQLAEDQFFVIVTPRPNALGQYKDVFVQSASFKI